MDNSGNVILRASETLSALLIARNCTIWANAIAYIKHLSYGRNSNRKDLSLVITEAKGTCSSKHAALKTIAIENNIPNVKLILSMYKMSLENTPGIGNYIINSGLPYIPEAHCYLTINGKRTDFTAPSSSIKRIEQDIISEIEIVPSQVGTWKVDFHKQFIEAWRISEGIPMTLTEIWEVREKCILSLSNS